MREQMWFGTVENMRWITPPLHDAEAGGDSWTTSDTYLNGGGFARRSFGFHRTYGFEWSEWSSYRAGKLMDAYYAGMYGRGLIYFIDPNTYDKNVFPERWSAPSMAVGYEGVSLVSGVDPEGVVTAGAATNDLPVASALYVLDDIEDGWRGESDTLFIPIPEGYTLYLGSFHTATGSGEVYASEVDSAGNHGADTALTPVALGATEILPDSFSGINGVQVWVGKSAPGAASVTATAMIARLYKTGETPPDSFMQGPWEPGHGHSGCEFAAVPTKTLYAGTDGGKAAYAASFIEVGDWQ